MQTPLCERVVVVSGASSGIGYETAKQFAQAWQCSIAIGARRMDRLQELKDELFALGAREVYCESLDVRSDASTTNFVSQLMQRFPQIDVLVNNAGLVLGVDHIADGAVQDWQTIFDTNVIGLLRLSRLVLPIMKQRQCGHIINIGSISGRQVYEGGGPYCGTKHAVKAITGTLKLELNGLNIRVSSIDPGLVETEFSVVRLGSEEKAKQVYQGMQPLTGADVAACVLFAANAPSHVNIDEILLTPTAQASASKVARKPVAADE